MTFSVYWNLNYEKNLLPNMENGKVYVLVSNTLGGIQLNVSNGLMAISIYGHIRY